MQVRPVPKLRWLALTAAVAAALVPAANAASPTGAAGCVIAGPDGLTKPCATSSLDSTRTHGAKNVRARSQPAYKSKQRKARDTNTCFNPYIPACRPNIGVETHRSQR
jgi:hypothetical protein